MTEMTTNSTAHSSEIAPYGLASSTWLATAKYANVKTPVEAIPIDRMRAPQRLARDRDQQPALRDARHLGDGVLGIGDVLEHLDRRGGVELAVGEGEVLGLHHPVLEVRRRALGPLGVES